MPIHSSQVPLVLQAVTGWDQLGPVCSMPPYKTAGSPCSAGSRIPRLPRSQLHHRGQCGCGQASSPAEVAKRGNATSSVLSWRTSDLSRQVTQLTWKAPGGLTAVLAGSGRARITLEGKGTTRENTATRSIRCSCSQCACSSDVALELAVWQT